LADWKATIIAVILPSEQCSDYGDTHRLSTLPQY